VVVHTSAAPSIPSIHVRIDWVGPTTQPPRGLTVFGTMSEEPHSHAFLAVIVQTSSLLMHPLVCVGIVPCIPRSAPHMSGQPTLYPPPPVHIVSPATRRLYTLLCMVHGIYPGMPHHITAM